MEHQEINLALHEHCIILYLPEQSLDDPVLLAGGAEFMSQLGTGLNALSSQELLLQCAVVLGKVFTGEYIENELFCGMTKL